jgi:branched-chain amino acid transport system permease protein
MITLALGQCVFFAAFQASSWTGGDNGLRDVVVPPFGFGGLTLNMVDPLVRYYVILLFVALALYFLFRVLSSPFGLTLEMIRENETRARSCGIDVVGAKRLAFVISGVVSGLAGALYAIHLSTVPLETLSLNTSGQVVMMVLLGGMGTFSGPFVGAAVFLVAEHVLSDVVAYWQTIVGLLFISAVLFFPKGIWGSLLALVRERR